MQGLVFLLLFYVQTGCSETESTEPNQGLDDVVINEFVATNTSDFVDEDGAASDWIELRNRGNTDVLLDGWYLTDDASEPRKWGFPAVRLEAGAYLVVFASGKDRRSDSGRFLHTNFKVKDVGRIPRTGQGR